VEKTIITTSWDDGHPADLRLAKLLKKYDIPATFYIPIKNIEARNMNPEQIKKISKNFDIGGHTYYHRRLPPLSDEEAFKEIIIGKKKLEEITGNEIVSFCYPGGKFDKKTVKLVKKAGFKLARTTRVLEYKKPTDLFTLGTTIQIGFNYRGHYLNFLKKSRVFRNIDLPIWLISNLTFNDWYELAEKSLEYIKKKGGIFHLWGHSHSMSNNDWKKLEVLFKKISNFDDVALNNNSDLLKYINK